MAAHVLKSQAKGDAFMIATRHVVAAIGVMLTLSVSPALATVTYSFTDKAGIFDDETSKDIVLSDSGTGLSTTMTVSANVGELNSNSGDFGIDSSIANEETDAIDGDANSEVLSLTFDGTIELVELDMDRIGTTSGDGADVTVGTFSEQLYTDATVSSGSFDAGSDIYTLSSPLEVSAGTAIELTGTSATVGTSGNSFGLENISLNVVPEPASAALLALGSLFMLGGRRRALRR